MLFLSVVLQIKCTINLKTFFFLHAGDTSFIIWDKFWIIHIPVEKILYTFIANMGMEAWIPNFKNKIHLCKT